MVKTSYNIFINSYAFDNCINFPNSINMEDNKKNTKLYTKKEVINILEKYKLYSNDVYISPSTFNLWINKNL